MYLARESTGGLLLFRDEPTKKKIVLNPDFPEIRKEVTTWETRDSPYGYLAIPNDMYIWVTFENSPVKVKLVPESIL